MPDLNDFDPVCKLRYVWQFIDFLTEKTLENEKLVETKTNWHVVLNWSYMVMKENWRHLWDVKKRGAPKRTLLAYLINTVR